VQSAYEGLRSQAFSLTAEQAGTNAATYGVLMETGYPEAVVTLVALADGTASLYFSNGGGIIGAGTHKKPAIAAQSLVAFASHNLQLLTQSNFTPLPEPGHTRFYVLTTSGRYTAGAAEADLGENRHVLSPLFHTAHALIYEMSQIDAARDA